MSVTVYHVLDISFAVVHFSVVLFNLTGWIWKATRRCHLIVISLTLLSWVALGAIFGFGYCPWTDWHWDVKRMLGERDLPSSYIKYYLDRLTGDDWNPATVDVVVVLFGIVPFALSLFLFLRDRRATIQRGSTS